MANEAKGKCLDALILFTLLKVCKWRALYAISKQTSVIQVGMIVIVV